jgi:cytidine deaminase
VVILRAMKAAPGVSRLLRAAGRARGNAHAPYSGFKVGAAVLAGGHIYSACNVENSSFPLSVCAERNAVAMAVAAGESRIDAVGVVGGATRPAAPCGGCRQVLAEFCGPDVPVTYATPDGAQETTTMAALLPASFGPLDLAKPDARTPTRRAPVPRRRKV